MRQAGPTHPKNGFENLFARENPPKFLFLKPIPHIYYMKKNIPAIKHVFVNWDTPYGQNPDTSLR
jgi:hypothetical protein